MLVFFFEEAPGKSALDGLASSNRAHVIAALAVEGQRPQRTANSPFERRIRRSAPAVKPVVCFGLRTDDVRRRDRLLKELLRDGRAFLTPTTYRGRPAIRAAFSSGSTTTEDVEIVARALDRAAVRTLEP